MGQSCHSHARCVVFSCVLIRFSPRSHHADALSERRSRADTLDGGEATWSEFPPHPDSTLTTSQPRRPRFLKRSSAGKPPRHHRRGTHQAARQNNASPLVVNRGYEMRLLGMRVRVCLRVHAGTSRRRHRPHAVRALWRTPHPQGRCVSCPSSIPRAFTAHAIPRPPAYQKISAFQLPPRSFAPVPVCVSVCST